MVQGRFSKVRSVGQKSGLLLWLFLRKLFKRMADVTPCEPLTQCLSHNRELTKQV